MATDSSTSLEPPLEPCRRELVTIAAQSAAIDELIALARHHIRVFDQDLSQTGWNSPERTARLSAFLCATHGHRVDVIVHDTHYLASACPRMLSLLRAYSHALTIYQTGAEAKVATDPLVIVDDCHYLHRLHFAQPRAVMGINQPEQTRPLANRFDEIWATGEPGITATVLGL